MKKSTDVLIITAPYTITESPLAAPAILTTILKEKYTVDFIDFNAEFNLNPDEQIIDYFLYKKITAGFAVKLSKYINDCIERVAHINPTWVAISVFTMYCQTFTELFCKTLRSKYPHIKIILGGQGLAPNGINSDESLGLLLQKDNFIDAWVKSESENVLLNLIERGGDIGTNNWKQITDLNSLQFPCYDYYDFKLYKDKSLPITGSRGCVRKCTFCDIHKHWQKFVFRSGEDIVNEITYQSKRTGITNFLFTDSLVNGSMVAYRNMVKSLSEYNETNSPISWSGQFLIRPKNQMLADDWKYTKSSGVRKLYCGIENLNEHIRDDMGKKFSNDDIFFALEQAQKNNIILRFMMIIGYVTETEKDHEEQMRLFSLLTPYKDVIEVNLGTTLGILPGTILHQEHKKFNIELGKNENSWSIVETDNTYETRLRRRKELELHLKDIGFLKDNTKLHLQNNLMELWK